MGEWVGVGTGRFTFGKILEDIGSCYEMSRNVTRCWSKLELFEDIARCWDINYQSLYRSGSPRDALIQSRAVADGAVGLVCPGTLPQVP